MDRPICRVCGKNPAKAKGKTDSGSVQWKTKCSSCVKAAKVARGFKPRWSVAAKATRNKINHLSKRPWRRYRKVSCEKCGFVPVHTCQLDVDHVDGNRRNNDPSNLMTLCANCHRLKTVTNGDHLPRVVVQPAEQRSVTH